MRRYKFTAEEQSLMEKLQVPFAVYQFIDKRIVTLVLSDGFCRLFGYDERSRACYDMDHDMYRDTHPDDVARISDAAFRFAGEGGSYEVVYRSRNKDRSGYNIIHAFGAQMHTHSGETLLQVWYADEGTYQEEAPAQGGGLYRSIDTSLHEESLLNTSYYDYLTGLPSLTHFFQLVEAMQAQTDSAQCPSVFLFLDLSGMKFFNSNHGFAEGDKLLRSFSRMLIQTFGSDNCCHVGGDHFAVYTKEEGLEDTLNRLFSDCRKLNGGKSLPVRVGIYPSRLEDVPVSIACDRAKFACDELRNTFESGFNYYNKDLRDQAERRQYILSNLDRALAERWIHVYYQPIVRAVNGHVCDEEALARWIDPVRGFLPPSDFIPFLEDAGLIYKMDLYVLDQILEKMRFQLNAGFHVVPHSVNLSRSDFDACDMVEEIRRRVDASGVGRDRITIEITESVIGSDFTFIKKQVERFQKLGFPVWMDDFGSGYSSLDVLQSVKFNLIKFDMSFMRKLDEGESGKIILTELMKMATSLGVDTVCEGVETEAQVRFLQEIGCSKLQGYYFSKPIPLEQILERYEKGIQIGYENPEESGYYEAIGRVNLYDLAVISNKDDDAFQKYFNTLPMAILTVAEDGVRFVRSNQSYRDFMERCFLLEMVDSNVLLPSDPTGPGAGFMKQVKRCSHPGGRAFFDEQMADGSTVHSFIRHIGENPVTGEAAYAIAVLSITDGKEGATYANIARALAADYYNIYYVDLETGDYIEYSSPVGGEELADEGHGKHFFEAARESVLTRFYEEDREPFLKSFTKENVLRELEEHGAYTATYRLMDTGTPMYVRMKAMRMRQDGKHLIIGISVVDSQMKQREMAEKIHREETAYARIMALSGDYLSLYTIDPESGRYFEYISTSEYNSLGFAKTGEDFFRQGTIDARKTVHPDDLSMFLSVFTKENVLQQVKEKGLFLLNYRLIISGQPQSVVLKIVSVTEKDGERLIAGVRMWKDSK